MTTPDPTTALQNSLAAAIKYADDNGIEIPVSMRIRARAVIAGKATGDMQTINATYHDAITSALSKYFEGGTIAGPRNTFRQATAEAFYDVFYLGWADGGGGTPDSDGIAWLDARIQQEYGYIEMLFQEARELKKEEDFDWFSWVTARADGYTNTIKELYNSAFARASKDIMVTFDGDDGAESCIDCMKYKGQRHRLSWFVKRNAVPPFGTGLECHKGGHCRHGLFDDNGNKVTA